MAKIVFLNMNHGSLEVELLGFIGRLAHEVDAFCFQEADEKILVKALKLLPTFSKQLAEKYVPNLGLYSVVTLINNKHQVSADTKIMQDNLKIGLSQVTTFSLNGREVLLCNVHGVSQPGDKMDNSERILQSKSIIDFALQEKKPCIIGGDFNLGNTTKSVQLFEESAFVNLIKKYKITTTRTKKAWQTASDNRETNGYWGKQLFADYVFVSPEIKVNGFEVVDIEISDHLPLILDFEV